MKDAEGCTTLQQTDIAKPLGGTVTVSQKNSVVWRNKAFADPEDHEPLERLYKRYGIGPFPITTIKETPTGQVVLQIAIEGALLVEINKKYFAVWK